MGIDRILSDSQDWWKRALAWVEVENPPQSPKTITARVSCQDQDITRPIQEEDQSSLEDSVILEYDKMWNWKDLIGLPKWCMNVDGWWLVLFNHQDGTIQWILEYSILWKSWWLLEWSMNTGRWWLILLRPGWNNPLNSGIFHSMKTLVASRRIFEYRQMLTNYPQTRMEQSSEFWNIPFYKNHGSF